MEETEPLARGNDPVSVSVEPLRQAELIAWAVNNNAADAAHGKSFEKFMRSSRGYFQMPSVCLMEP